MHSPVLSPGFNQIDQALQQIAQFNPFRLQSCNGSVEFTAELFSRHLFYALSHLFLPGERAVPFGRNNERTGLAGRLRWVLLAVKIPGLACR